VTVDGRRVAMADLGDGPPVVLLHGLLGSPYYLLPLARAVARSGRRVLVPWLPGHGPSDRLEPFTFDGAADLLAAAAREVGVERPAVFGHSFGAPLAVTWAARHPAEALVAASPVGVAPLDLGPAVHALRLSRAIARAAPLVAEFARSRLGRWVVFGWFVGMVRPDAVDPATAADLIRSAATAEPSLHAMLTELQRLDVTDAARQVDCPSLVVWGALDRDGILNGPGLAAALRCRTAVMPEIGHMPMFEAPYAFRTVLRGFV
jgi:pimeloyl-ACP methyl ester carboxylesterase